MQKVNSIDYIYRLMQKMQPSMSWREDFDVWQKEAREKLADLLGMDRFEKVDPQVRIEYETKIEGGTEIRFLFDSEEGLSIPCHMVLPDGVEKPPIIICLQGHTTGMHNCLGRVKHPSDADNDSDHCLQAIRRGFAAVAMELRDFGELSCDPVGFPRCPHESGIATLMGRTTIGERVWDIQRLIDVLEKEFADRVDVNTVCCMGNSGGGTASIYAGALEDRLKLVCPAGSMATFKDSIGAMHHCACNYVPHIAEYFDMGDLMAMAYPKYFVQVNGKEDPIFPVESAKAVFAHGRAAYESQGGGDRCTLIIGPEGHRNYPDLTWPVICCYLKGE